VQGFFTAAVVWLLVVVLLAAVVWLLAAAVQILGKHAQQHRPLLVYYYVRAGAGRHISAVIRQTISIIRRIQYRKAI